MENRQETVTVTYSAEEQKEMKAIRARYMPEEKKTLTDLEKARAIDARVERKGLLAGVLLGIAGTLVMGLGMSMSMVWNLMVPGIAVGLLGIAAVVMAWLVYQRVVRRERKRAADEIMALTAEE